MLAKKKAYLISYALLVLLLISAASYFVLYDDAVWPQKVVSLTAGNFEHIQFSSKSPNLYKYQDDELIIDVENSASFLMQAYNTVKNINSISFDWKSEGRPAIKDAEHESQRDGDDAVFKLGLLLESEDMLPDVFLPSWMKQVNNLLNFQSKNMIFLVAGAKHGAGETWSGPYSHRMTMISVNSATDVEGWTVSNYQFAEPVKVVAIWLMADGDDTHSTFTSRVKNIVIDEQNVVDDSDNQ